MAETLDDGPEISPSVVFLPDLLRWVKQGRIRVPAFQRSYVWSRQDMLDLFDSVRMRFPIGTLLFWKSTAPGAKPQNHFGPFDVSGLPNQDVLLVLDGQQRLTTLAGVLLQDVLPRATTLDEDPHRWRVFFDADDPTGKGPRKGVFTHLRDDTAPLPWQVPVQQLLDTNGLFKVTNKLLKAAEAPGGLAGMTATAEEMVDRIQDVARSLQSYKVPVVEFVTPNLSLAVQSFTRLNRKGVTIGADEMFSALTFEAGAQDERFHVARSIDGVLADLKSTGFGPIDRVFVLRAFLVAAGLDPYRTDWNALGDDKRSEIAGTLPAAMARARSGLLAAIEFLRSEGVHNSRLLPYGLQLVGLSAWLGADPQPTPAARRLLRRWFWLTGFTSWFGQGNPSRYAAVLTEMQAVASAVGRGERDAPDELANLPWSTPAEPFPARYDLRSARVRTHLCVLFQQGALALDGTSLNSAAIAAAFSKSGPEAMRRIWVPGRESKLSSSPANRMFDVFAQERGQARVLLRSHRDEMTPEFLKSHHLPESVGAALKDDEVMRQVLESRLVSLQALELDFLSSLELASPTATGPRESTLDVDDDAPLPDSAPGLGDPAET